MSKDLKKIKIDGINLGSNFEVASYRTQRNTGGVAPLRGNGNIIATNNFVLDDEVVLNFKVNKADLVNFCKIYSRFKTKGMLLIESPLLAYKLVHGDMENMYTFNYSFIAGSLVTKEEAKRMTDEILKTKHFFAMLSDFNIKSLHQTAGGFEIEMVLQTWSDLINNDVVKMYNDMLKKQSESKSFIEIDSIIVGLIKKEQNLKLNFTVTNEEILTSDFGNEYVKKTKAEVIEKLEKIESEKFDKNLTDEQKKETVKKYLRVKLKKEMFWSYYQISEFEVRIKNNIATIPIQGKPKPFKQHLGLGECYITVKIIMDENNAKDKEKIKEIKRLTSIKQNDIFTEIDFGIINALDLKSVTVANVFFTNDDESDSVIVSIIFAANAYSREDLSFYNPNTIADQTTDNTYLAFNKWLNMVFANPQEFKNYKIDVGDKEHNTITLLDLSGFYNNCFWQRTMLSDVNNVNFSNIKNWTKNTNDGIAESKNEDLACITEVNEVIELYSFLLLKNSGKLDSEQIKSFKKLFAYGEDGVVKRGTALDKFLNFKLPYAITNMATQSSDEYQDKDGFNTFLIVMRSFYSDFQDRLQNLYKYNITEIEKSKLVKDHKNDIGQTIDIWVDGALKNLGKSESYASYKTIAKNDMLGFFKTHLNDETTKQNVFSTIMTQIINSTGYNQQIEDSLKLNINKAINNMNTKLDVFIKEPEIIKTLCKTIVKLKTFKYFAGGISNEHLNKIGLLIMNHIMSTILMIPFMLDIYNVSSIYGHSAMRSAEYVIQFYKVLFKSCAINVGKSQELKQKNLSYILNKIFGDNFGYLLTSGINVDKKFKEKKDYQKYLNIEIGDSNKSFKMFFNVIMNVQAHKTKQDFFTKHLQHIEQIQKTLEKDLQNNQIINPLNYTDAEKESYYDNDQNKKKAIDDFLSDSNLIYQDMFASDLDSTGTLYAFNKLLGGNNIKNWFAKNNIAVRQAASLKFIYKKYENIQRIFNYEYNKILPDYRVTLINESITNGVVHKRRYVNLNNYVGLDKVINISINFDEETRIKTAIIQLIDSTNLLSTMSQEIVVKSPYRDILQTNNKQEITYNDDYYSEYPMIKPGQLIKIEMGYIFEDEMKTEFTGVIASVNTGRITTIICNNFMADLANGDISIQRYSERDGILNEIKNFSFLHIPSKVSDSIGDLKDTAAKAKEHYNNEFINSSVCKPYSDVCETASNFNILAEAIRKQPNSLLHLNNRLDEIKQFGELSNEKAERASFADKARDALYFSESRASRIYDNINNVDQDEEIYGHVLIIDPDASNLFDRYIVSKDNSVAEKFKKINEEYEKNTKVETLKDWASVFSRLPLEIKKMPFFLKDYKKIESIIFRTGSPFCANNFQNIISLMEKNIDVSNNIGYSENHETKSYASNFAKKHTNVYEILKVIEARMPGVFFNVLEYGDFGTLFLGRENYNIKTIKETSKITECDASFLFGFNLIDLQNEKNVKNFNIYSLSNINKLEILAACAVTGLSGKFDEATQNKILSTKSNFITSNKTKFDDIVSEYKNVHTVVSGKNLVSCNIQINSNFYNTVFVDYKLSLQDFFNEIVNLRFGGITLKLYNGLSKDKSRIKKIDHKKLYIYTRTQALSVAQSALINEVENIYSGEIVTLYMPGIKYRDEVVIQNYEDKIFGTVVVKNFKHIFNQDGAFTIITPMMKVQMNSLSNELLHDSLFSQLIFLNPEFKSQYTPPVSEVDKIFKNMLANDALQKPIYFDGYAYELEEKNPNSEEGFVEKEIPMNTKLPLKVFPLIQKDVFLFPDMEDYGRQQPTFIARLINYFGIKKSQFGYFIHEYNWWKQIGLYASQTFYNLTSSIRNWYNESGENLKYQSPDSVFLGDVYKQTINNITSVNTFQGTMQDTIHQDSRITKAQETATNDYGFLWFNTKDTVAGTPNIKGDIKLKGNAVSKKKQKEKQILLGDMASQFDIISFVEIYAYTIEEAIAFAKGICDRASSMNVNKKFAVASAALLSNKDYSFVKQNGKYVISNTIKTNASTGIKESYNRILQSVIDQNEFDIISISALNKLKGTVVKNDGINVDDSKDNLNEYGVVIYNSVAFTPKLLAGETLQKIKQSHLEQKIKLDGFEKGGNNLFIDSNKYNCLLSINEGESNNEKVRRNASITFFDVNNEKYKKRVLENNLIAISCFHNYYGSGDKITVNLEKRKKCAQMFFEGISNTFNEDCGIVPIIMGDFNLDITTVAGKDSYDSERYFLNSSKLENRFLQKTHSPTTLGNKSYDKMFVSDFYKDKTTVANVYQQYLIPATNTETNTQSNVSDHLPLIMYLTKE